MSEEKKDGEQEGEEEHMTLEWVMAA